MTNLHQHGLNRAVLRHLRARFPSIRVDLKFDGYEFPVERPLILVETMQNNFEYIAKLRESVGTTYRYQIGLFDRNSVDLSINQERMQNVLLFDDFAFYDTLSETPNDVKGFFNCKLTSVVPLSAEDITKRTEYNRVYFDVEISDIKRRCY